jgi:hypothetical protein
MGLSDCDGYLGHWSLAFLQRRKYFDMVLEEVAGMAASERRGERRWDGESLYFLTYTCCLLMMMFPPRRYSLCESDNAFMPTENVYLYSQLCIVSVLEAKYL